VILNGIEDIVRRPDLADRGLFLTLEAIPENRRRPQAELWAAFLAELPPILGVLVEGVVEGLKRLPTTRLANLPRMADFALWATACETALWPAGTFGAAYKNNRDDAIEAVIEADPVAAAVRSLTQTGTVWTGTATDLLVALTKLVGDRVARSKNWPNSPEALSGRVRRAATFLRTGGIEIVFNRLGRGRTRTIIITNTQPSATGKGPSAPSAPPAPPPYVRTTSGNGQDVSGFGPCADSTDASFPIQSVPGKPTTPNECTAAGSKESSCQKLENKGFEAWRFSRGIRIR
jgi:hypothetical protein